MEVVIPREWYIVEKQIQTQDHNARQYLSCLNLSADYIHSRALTNTLGGPKNE